MIWTKLLSTQSYAVAQLDRAPEYGLDIVPGADPNAELLFDNLPAGSFIMFLCTGGISFLFQIVGCVSACMYMPLGSVLMHCPSGSL